MRIYIKIKPFAFLLKVMGWGVVILAARSNLDMASVAMGCGMGIFLSEVADIWYKISVKCERALEKSA